MSPSDARRVPPPLPLYGLVVFAAAWLVFWVQPLAARGILPILGGSPAVWNTAMVFFQAALLAGYALAHFLVRRVPGPGQIAILATLWAVAALTAPVGGPRLLGETPGGLPAALWLLGTLTGALGVAFVAVATLTPLVQAWLARAGIGPASADPYFLYSASNAGSAGALLAYPFLIEPLLGLERQAWAWSATFLVLAPFLFFLWRASCAGRAPSPETTATNAPHPPPELPVVRVLALSAVPSALLLSITRYISTDVAAVPLLWIVPLVLYLGTFVHAFARRPAIPNHVLARIVPFSLIFLAIAYLVSQTVLVFGVVHVVVFTLIALYCHGALARLRPPAADLTRFYLLVSAGGLTGGLLVALAAPIVFSDVHEYPIALAAAAALLPPATFAFRRRHLLVAALALAIVSAAVAAAIVEIRGSGDGVPPLAAGMFALVALAAPALLVLRAKPLLLAGALLALFFIPSAISERGDEHVARERTFFGVYRVVDADGKRSFHHGTTLHGAEWPRADGTIESRTTYYGTGTPHGEVFTALARRPSPVVIGLAGLGTGSLACYARPGDEVRIYEIDPVVVELARKHFSALRDCAPEATYAIGDARLLIARESATLDVLALDTFSSDAIPVHLLTVQAFETYLRVLAPDGIVSAHISNRHLDLEPVLAALAERLGLAARIKRYAGAGQDEPPPRLWESSVVAVLAREEDTLEALALDGGWVPLEAPGRVRAWTDDYTSIVPLLRLW